MADQEPTAGFPNNQPTLADGMRAMARVLDRLAGTEQDERQRLDNARLAELENACGVYELPQEEG